MLYVQNKLDSHRIQQKQMKTRILLPKVVSKFKGKKMRKFIRKKVSTYLLYIVGSSSISKRISSYCPKLLTNIYKIYIIPMDNQQRALEIFKSLRLIDGEETDQSIEFFESEGAKDQRKVVRQLLKKGFSDREIYLEIQRIFGPQSIMYLNINDEPPKSNFWPIALTGMGIMPVFYFLKKAMRK